MDLFRIFLSFHFHLLLKYSIKHIHLILIFYQLYEQDSNLIFLVFFYNQNSYLQVKLHIFLMHLIIIFYKTYKYYLRQYLNQYNIKSLLFIFQFNVIRLNLLKYKKLYMFYHLLDNLIS